MQRKSLKVSCVLGIGRGKISGNHKLILLIFASKDLSFFLFSSQQRMCPVVKHNQDICSKVFGGFKVPDWGITVKECLEMRICY